MNSLNMLVAIDFSDQCREVLQGAIELAEQNNAKSLTLLHVIPDAPVDVPDDLRRQALTQLANLIPPEKELGIHPKKAVRSGPAHQAIIDYAIAHHTDVVIIGSHGRQRMSQWALGSSAERIVQRAPCTVHIVRSKKWSHKPTDEPIFTPTNDEPGIELVRRARILRATDIHLDPGPADDYRVRFRIDGQLHEYCRLDRSVAEHLINQWKLFTQTDMSDPFRPHEGSMKFPKSATDLSNVYSRLTTTPVVQGQAVALRMFSQDDIYMPLHNLGFSDEQRRVVDQILRNGEGLVLVSGPTGSGKTTTVYSMLESISSNNRNIVSIEDPVEYPVAFVRQMAVDERHDLGMTKGLRTLLRMDPDVVFLGEIRDTSAAEIAMQAAASGRYVFSTLHTRNVAAVFTALRDMGLGDRSLSANVAGVINQRLMRRLCFNCRREVSVTDEVKRQCELHNIDAPTSQYERVGCPQCRDTGYRGRIGIFEAASLTRAVRDAVAAGETESKLQELLVQEGLVTLAHDALTKVVAGITDEEEMKRVHWV